MILVTGAGGFLGAALLPCLKRAQMQVLPVFRSGIWSCSATGAALDLTSPEHLSSLNAIAPCPETVIHLAGRVEISLVAGEDGAAGLPVPGPENLPEIYAANVTATANLLRYCLDAGVRHLIFASSQAVYGLPPSPEVTEETPCRPLEHYALSKVCCEQMLRLAPADRISVTVLRFPGIYAEQRTSGAVYAFCNAALRSREIRVTAEIPLPFDALHLDDATSAILCAVRAQPAGYAVFNIASGEPNSLDLLANRIAGMVPGCTVVHAPVPQPVIRLDPAKARTVLGWQAAPPERRLRAMLGAMRHA